MSAAPRGVAEKARKAALVYLRGGVTYGALAERFGISKGSICVALREIRRGGVAAAVSSMGNPATLLMPKETLGELMDLERARISSEIRDRVTNAGDTGNIAGHDGTAHVREMESATRPGPRRARKHEP